MKTLMFEGTEYFAVPDKASSVCRGCAFEGRRHDPQNPCPQRNGDNACLDGDFAHGPEMRSSIFVTEDEYLKRRLKGET